METHPSADVFDAISFDPQLFVLESIAPERIVVINLDRRPDRWDALLAAWHPDLASRFLRFSATDGRRLSGDRVDAYAAARKLPKERAAAEIACRDSWRRAVIQNGPGLYFEDDARPCAPWSLGRPPADAEIVLLGGELWSKAREPGWVHAGAGLNGTHALWIRTPQAAHRLTASWDESSNPNMPADFVWRSALEVCQAVLAVPQIVCQANLGTDVQIGRIIPSHGPSLVDPWCSLASPVRPSRQSTSPQG
ncbi:MAG: hypothetical protein AB7G88_08250 [Thermomicrobiales bacterium]